MKAIAQLRSDIAGGIQDLIERYKQKSDLLQAEETHGEKLDRDFIDNKLSELRDLLDRAGSVLEDLSYIS